MKACPGEQSLVSPAVEIRGYMMAPWRVVAVERKVREEPLAWTYIHNEAGRSDVSPLTLVASDLIGPEV